MDCDICPMLLYWSVELPISSNGKMRLGILLVVQMQMMSMKQTKYKEYFDFRGGIVDIFASR